MKNLGYLCERSEVGPYKLFSNIVRNIEECDLVIAVLTDFNSNVWYELGIRHTLTKAGTIMLLQDDQKPSFDVSDFGIIFYHDSIRLEDRLKTSIKGYIDKLDSASASDSPVISGLKTQSHNNGKDEARVHSLMALIWNLMDSLPKSSCEQVKDKKGKILWVDDYPANNQAIVTLFEEQNIHFDIALTTDQGLELYRQNMYDLIITDMGRDNEPDAGLSFLKGLKLLQCIVPVIVYCSFNAVSKYKDKALQSGAYTVTNEKSTVISAISARLGL